MAPPTTTYDTATLVNPSTALTDFTLMVDLSRLSAAWWAAVNTSEDRKGRAYKDDGTTELAIDFLDFDDVGETGWARVKWSGTLATSGTQSVRIYPPNTANSTVLRTDTFGAYNAYDSIHTGYWPLMEDGNDRTVSQNHGTIQVGHTIGGATGQAGNATAFDGIDQFINIPHDTSLDMPGNIVEVSCWGKAPFEPNDWGGFVGRAGPTNNWDYFLGHRGGSHSPAMSNQTVAVGTQALSGDDFSDVWEQYIGTLDGDVDDEAKIIVNTVTKATTASTTIGLNQDTKDIWIGLGSVSGVYIDADIQHVKIESAIRSDAWRAQEYAQTNDQPAFWGTWTNNPVTSTRRVMIVS